MQLAPEIIKLNAQRNSDGFQITIPSSWAGLLAFLTAEKQDLPEKEADIDMIRQFIRLQLTSITDLKAEYKRRFQKKCPLDYDRADLIFRIIRRIYAERYAPEKVWRELKIDSPDAYNERAIQMAQPGVKTRLINGTIIERIYKRRVYTIHCINDLYEYRGAYYNTLTEVAQHITKTRCAGPVFFSRRTKFLTPEKPSLDQD